MGEKTTDGGTEGSASMGNARTITPPPSTNELLETAKKVANWFEAQAARNDREALHCRFERLKAAYIADSKTYRAMAKELRTAIRNAEQAGVGKP